MRYAARNGYFCSPKKISAKKIAEHFNIESFNIGNQKAVVTIFGLANTIIRVLESKSPIIYSRKDYVDVELRIPSVRKAKELLDFEAKVDMEEGIRLAAEYYRSQMK